ncbi:MAG: peptide-methionine (S)-S-oxide reductase MsrA [Gluconacetobacter diazotrophicus]|nr:peptide-methionine (S)-S-oxide reductase MsrA [Gluconacetobacter diazotrophicus]
MVEQRGAQTAQVVLGGGCFWCVEAVFKDVEGVSAVMSGYSGGDVPDPSYEAVCTGRTGHAEVVRVEYDPAVVAYADLLRMFFTIHDPTTPDRQGADVGSQYRSVIFTGSAEEEREARAVIAEVEASGAWDGRVVTQVVPEAPFYPAEIEHHDYFARNPGSGYCRVVVAPKVSKFRKQFADRLRRKAG